MYLVYSTHAGPIIRDLLIITHISSGERALLIANALAYNYIYALLELTYFDCATWLGLCMGVRSIVLYGGGIKSIE